MGGLRGLENDRGLTVSVSAGEGGAVEHDPWPAVGTHSGLGQAAARRRRVSAARGWAAAHRRPGGHAPG
jgi:hypothetical protein